MKNKNLNPIKRKLVYGVKIVDRFFFDTDGNYWYLVLEDYRKEWSIWNKYPKSKEAGWLLPAYASRLNCSLSDVTFEKPNIKN